MTSHYWVIRRGQERGKGMYWSGFLGPDHWSHLQENAAGFPSKELVAQWVSLLSREGMPGRAVKVRHRK